MKEIKLENFNDCLFTDAKQIKSFEKVKEAWWSRKISNSKTTASHPNVSLNSIESLKKENSTALENTNINLQQEYIALKNAFTNLEKKILL